MKKKKRAQSRFTLFRRMIILFVAINLVLLFIMPTLSEQFKHIRSLIVKEQYDEALELLYLIDHPKADEWIEKVYARQGQSQSSLFATPSGTTSTSAPPKQKEKPKRSQTCTNRSTVSPNSSWMSAGVIACPMSRTYSTVMTVAHSMTSSPSPAINSLNPVPSITGQSHSTL